jgi:hypothetical protein
VRCLRGEGFADRDGVLIRATPIRRGATAPIVSLRIEVIDIGKLAAGKEAIPYVASGAFDSRATARSKSSGQADLRPFGFSTSAFEELHRCFVEVSRASRSPRNVVDFHLEPLLVKASAKVIDLCQWNPRPARMPYIVGSLASRDKYHIYLLWKYNQR